MYYEWNEIRFRRQYLIKFVSVWAVAITLAFLPVWWLVQESTFPWPSHPSIDLKIWRTWEFFRARTRQHVK